MENRYALEIAKNLVERLRPACERIEIAGSIRRGKADVKDIEILAIPDPAPVPRGRAEFGKPLPPVYKTCLDQLIAEMERGGLIRMEASGDKYKKFWLKDGMVMVIKVDLFLVTPPATWGVQMAIRTGPADFSHWIVTRKKAGGALPNDYRVQDGAVWKGPRQDETDILVGFDEEIDFLSFLGLGWIEPREREAKWTK